MGHDVTRGLLFKVSLLNADKNYTVDHLYFEKQRRYKRVQDMRPMTDAEIDKHTVEELVEMERLGIAKMPADIYEAVLLKY